MWEVLLSEGGYGKVQQSIIDCFIRVSSISIFAMQVRELRGNPRLVCAQITAPSHHHRPPLKHA